MTNDEGKIWRIAEATKRDGAKGTDARKVRFWGEKCQSQHLTTGGKMAPAFLGSWRGVGPLAIRVFDSARGTRVFGAINAKAALKCGLASSHPRFWAVALGDPRF
jgi:hypothetical protein